MKLFTVILYSYGEGKNEIVYKEISRIKYWDKISLEWQEEATKESLQMLPRKEGICFQLLNKLGKSEMIYRSTSEIGAVEVIEEKDIK